MRKQLRKMLAMMMVVAIVLSLVPNVFAANNDTLEFTNLYDYKTSGMYNNTIWHKYSNYIPVTAGDVIHLGPCVPTQSFHIVQFDSGKTNLSSNVKGADMSVESTFPNGLVVYKWTVPSGTSYIRVPNNICVDEVFVVTKNEPFTAEDCYTYWAQTNVEYDALVSGGHTNPTPASQITQLFDVSKTASGVYDESDSKVLAENSSYVTTELIPVSAGDKLYFGKTTLLGKFQLKTFDAQKNAISGKIQSPACDIVQMFSDATAILSYTVPAGVSYVAVSCETSYKSSYLLTKNQPFNETIMNEVLGIQGGSASGVNSAYITKDPNSPLKGLKIGFFGDSISAANKEKGTEYDVIRGWAGRIGYKNQMEYYNMSVSGSSISTARAKLIYSQITGSKTNPVCDIYVMHGGTNDAWESAPVGDTDLKDFSGDYDYSTFAGGLDKCLFTLKQQYPNAKVCYIINYKFTNPGSSKMQLTRMDGYVAMTKKICEKWGVPYLDLYSNNELLASLKSETTEFLYDGVHLSSAGYELVTPYIEDFIKKVASGAITSGGTTGSTGNTGSGNNSSSSSSSNKGKTETISMTLSGFGLSPNENVDDATEAAHKADVINKQFGNIVITVNKGESTKDSPKVFKNETRVYAKNMLTIAPAKGYKITSITMVTQGKKPIGTAMDHLAAVLSNATTTCAAGDTVATFKPVDGTKAVVIKPGDQFRVISMEVTYEKVSSSSGTESSTKTETMNTNYQSFGLTTTKTDNDGNPYFQNGNFYKSFTGFTISFAPGSATKNDPAAYGNEVRLYDGNILSITPAKGYKITSIVINSQSKKPLGNTMAHLATVVSNATFTCEVGATMGVFVPVNGTKSVDIKSGEQVRITSIEVTYELATGEEGSNGSDNPNEVLTNYETFELLTNKMDSLGNPYYQESGFLKTFDFFTIAFGNGISEKDFVAAYGDSVRVYPGNTLTISPVKGYKITSIVIHSMSEKSAGSAIQHLSTEVKNASATCQMGDTSAVLTPVDGTKAIVLKPGEQMWITSIEVIYAEATAEDSKPSTSKPAGDAAQPDAAPAEDNTGAVVAIIVVVVLVLGGGAAAAVFFLRKKKSAK